MSEKQLDIANTNEACEHFRYFFTSDNDMFVINMVTNHAAEVPKANDVKYIVCPYCEVAYQIDSVGTVGVGWDKEADLPIIGPFVEDKEQPSDT